MQQDAADTVNKDARPEDCYILFSSHTDGWRLYELARAAGAKPGETSLDTRVR